MVKSVSIHDDSNSFVQFEKFLRHFCCCCCCCCLSPTKTLYEDQQHPKESEKICFDLEHVKRFYSYETSSKLGKEQQHILTEEFDDGVIPADFFDFFHEAIETTRDKNVITKNRIRTREDLCESYGPSTSNWTDETDSSETSSPVFAPIWKRNRVKLFQNQRRYFRTQHPRRIYAARHLLTTQKSTGTSNSTTTNSISTIIRTPGLLKRFSCRSNLFEQTTKVSFEKTSTVNQINELRRQSAEQRHDEFMVTKNLHSTVVSLQGQNPSIVGIWNNNAADLIRPLHRTMSAHATKMLIKLPPLNEKDTPSQQLQIVNLEILETTNGPPSNIADFASTTTPNTQIIADSKFVNIHNFIVGFRRRISHLSLTSNFSSDASFYLLGHRRRPPFEDSTIYTTETDARIYSDDESRLSTSTDNVTSVSRQHYNLYRRRRRQTHRNPRRQQPSRASSLSSMTETSMALEVITVTLNMDPINYLGISIVGQSSSRGDNGIYVANVMPGGAAALDGRIEPGDMILQVNDISFEDFKNDKAVEVLKQAVNQKGPIKLTVAKSFDAGRAHMFSVPIREPVRPIDTQAWVQHTNAVRGMTSTLVNAMNAIPEGSEGAPTPIPGQYPPSQVNPIITSSTPFTGIPTINLQHQRPASSSTTATSNGSTAATSGPTTTQTILGPGGVFLAIQQRLDLYTDKRKVVKAMIMPNSGLDIRDRTWLKIPIPMSFLGSSLVDWLLTNINGIRDRKGARRYAAELLKENLIAHVVNKQQFTEQCYYVFGKECTEFLCNQNNGQKQCGQDNEGSQHIEMSNKMMFAGANHQMPPYMHKQHTSISGSEYASMPPLSPYSGALQIEYSQRQQQFGQPPC